MNWQVGDSGNYDIDLIKRFFQALLNNWMKTFSIRIVITSVKLLSSSV